MTLVPMPEATMDKHSYSVLRQDNVRNAGKFTDVQPEPETTGEQKFTHPDLRGCILASNCTHVFATYFRAVNIAH